MLENLACHPLILDERDHSHRSVALGACEHIEGPRAFQQRRPAEPPVARGLVGAGEIAAELWNSVLRTARRRAFRAASCLDRPFDVVCEELGLKKDITARAMRRTFNDLCRRAQVESVVTRSISGHATEQMKQHYETVNVEEKRQSLAKVISLAGFREVFFRGSVGAPESAVGEAGEAA